MLKTVFSVVAWSWLLAVQALSAAEGPAGFDNPFFAFDNGVGRGTCTPDEQAGMLAELGYAGIGYSGCGELPQRWAAFERRGLKVFSIYVGSRVGPDGPTFDPGLKTAIQQLKGRQTILWLTIQGRAENGDEQAVEVVREIADLAAASQLRVVLYPHVGFHVASTADALRIVRASQRKNVGVSWNLCHFLKLDKEQNLRAQLTEALPYLELVSINGADSGDTPQMGWERLIQPLDRGTFDTLSLLRLLRELGYRGPIGLQCYNVPGDQKENLQRSMAAWKELVQKLNSP